MSLEYAHQERLPDNQLGEHEKEDELQKEVTAK